MQKSTTKEIGDKAETIAAGAIAKLGFKIIARNWRTRTCEIDIIAQKDDQLHFFEVRYRKNDAYGGGLESIDDEKLNRMYDAAEEWVMSTDHQGEWVVGAVEVTGLNFRVSRVIPDIGALL